MPHIFCGRRAISEMCGCSLPLLKMLKIHVFQLFSESGSEQPYISESFALQKVCGVAPDIAVDMDPALVRQGHDPQLEKALQVVMEELV
jgi:hypothetical protein